MAGHGICQVLHKCTAILVFYDFRDYPGGAFNILPHEPGSPEQGNGFIEVFDTAGDQVDAKKDEEEDEYAGSKEIC